MSNLSSLQFQFLPLIAKLIAFAYEQGYTLTEGEGWRTPEQAAMNAKKGTGILHSLHTERLAMDFNLFKNGEYLGKTNDHLPLGEFWEKLHPLARWGGRFGDGNHYSLEYNGFK